MENNKASILSYWQPLVGIGTFLVAGGIFYNKVVTMQQKDSEIEKRQDRQFELIQSIDKRLIEQERKAAYREGYEKAKQEVKQP